MSTRSALGRQLAALVAAVSMLMLLSGGAAAAPGFPVRLHAADGTVTIAAAPVRIVSLSPSATQDLYAVGAGGQVVAVDSESTYPPQAPRTGLLAYTPNAEAIARYRPDLVIVASDSDNIVSELRTLHIPVLLEPAASSLAGVYGEITQIGAATGHPASAVSVVTAMRRSVAAIVASVKPLKRPLTVYHELGPDYYSATSRTFIGQLYRLLGLGNIADRAPGSSQYPQLSAEYIVSSDPDLIVLADTVCCRQTAKTVAARPGWSTIAAVKDGAVVPVDDSIASQWGPRILVFLRVVAAEVRRLEAPSR
jgi:iron complex transport system substrate-binding protein